MRVRRCSFSNTNLTAPLNTWSKCLLRYVPKRPEHRNGASHLIPLSSTTYWIATQQTTASPSSTPTYVQSDRNTWREPATASNYRWNSWGADLLLTRKSSREPLSRAWTSRFVVRLTSSAWYTSRHRWKIWLKRRNLLPTFRASGPA